MPHCQKEKHDHTAKSKKERQQKKEEMLARRKAAKARELEAELEAAKLKPNNIFLSDGFGEYLVGCEPEKELKAPRFNVNKRSKKHLRIDVRKKEERKEREEQEQLKKENEEQYRLQQEKLKQEAAGSGNHEEEEQEQEEEPIIKEYLVYICQCCYKKFNTTNQFVNHSNSKKHRYNARLYEEAGVIVTEIQVRRNNDDDDEYSYEEEDYEEDDEFDQGREECGEFGSYYDNGDDSEEDEEEDEDEDDDEDEDEEPATKARNVFSAFADDSDSSSESSSDSSDEEDEDITEVPAVSSGQSDKDDNDDDTECDDHDDLDILEEIIYQNRLQERFFPESDVDEEDNASKTVVPVPYDGEWYNPDNLNADENRLASIQHRLQKRLAARGIEPSRVNTGYTTSSDAVSIGKTLLQQVMEASFETLEARLAAYNKHKAEYQLLGREFRFAGGNSKALPSQYTFRIDPADNSRRRENTHHTGSHYHMANARSMNHGRIKGMLARHSSQGARLQSSRMAAKEMARVQGGGLKIGKTSKKSQQKRKGEAGGSKKSGGTASEK